MQVRVNVWDTAGQERFHSLLPSYCRGAHGALFVFDLTDLRSFLRLDSCLRQASLTLPPNHCKVSCLGWLLHARTERGGWERERERAGLCACVCVCVRV